MWTTIVCIHHKHEYSLASIYPLTHRHIAHKHPFPLLTYSLRHSFTVPLSFKLTKIRTLSLHDTHSHSCVCISVFECESVYVWVCMSGAGSWVGQKLCNSSLAHVDLVFLALLTLWIFYTRERARYTFPRRQVPHSPCLFWSLRHLSLISHLCCKSFMYVIYVVTI